MNCYNGEEYLREAIDSVINQTYKNWEIIFWDNQSTDKSAEIFKAYKDKRLKYYCPPTHINILYKARNCALKKVNGDFIAFLDVDDWWSPDKLEKQIPLFEDSKVGLVYGNLWWVFEKKNRKKVLKKKFLPTGMILSELLNENVIGSPTYVIRKKSLESLEYFFNDHFHIIGDYDLYVRLAAKWKFNCIQTPVAYARIHGKNESLLNKNKEIQELKIWYNRMKKNQIITSEKELNKIHLQILYLETMEAILRNEFRNSLSMVTRYPFCFNKIKLIIALFLPNFVIQKIKDY
jgi:glycosyltransferase involved in cell wall biosynthesis